MKTIHARRLVAIALLLCALVTSGCLGGIIPKPSTPKPLPAPADPFIDPARDDEFRATCAAVYEQELGRAIDPAGADECLRRCRVGQTGEDLRLWLRGSLEYTDRQARLEREAREAEEQRASRYAFRGALRVQGTSFVGADGKAWLPVLTSAMALPSVVDSMPFIDWLTGKLDPAVEFNGGRFFVGDLNWHDLTQTAHRARDALPRLLGEFRARGRYVLVTAITDSRAGGYDIEAHLREVAAITRDFENVLLEVANEPYHGTQADSVNDFAALCSMARRVLADYPHPWALGAAPDDRPIGGRYATDCGTFNTAHLRRGNEDDMLAGMYGLAEIMAVTGKPVINSEMIGAAEVDRPGSRITNPRFFDRAAHRGVSLGFGNLFHSSDGLYGRVPGPVQHAAARAFVEGSWREPAPVPPAPPSADPCATASDPVSIVNCNRRKLASGRLGHEDLAVLMRAIARDLNAKAIAGGPYGVLVKTRGNNCGGYSCDIICTGNGAEQKQFDVLIDENLPTWSPLGDGIRVDVCEVVWPDVDPARAPWTPALEGSLGAYPIPPIVGMTGRQ